MSLMSVLVLSLSAAMSSGAMPGATPVLSNLQDLQDSENHEDFRTPYSLDEMRGKQAVLETVAGTIVIQLLPEAAPNHVGFFIEQARAGAYDGTTFHRVLPHAIIQGGDPLSRDPSRAAEYGQGGFNHLRFEPSDVPHAAGAVSAVLVEGDADSGGFQFFICASDQPGLDGKYTVFGQVIDGLEVADSLSAVNADAGGVPNARLVISSVTIRDTPPEPFVDATVLEMARYHAVFETTMGTIEMELFPDRAPETVRQFLRLIDAGVYEGVLVHRVANNFVIQTGDMTYRAQSLTARQRRLIHPLEAELTESPNVPGFVSMARAEYLHSATTSFFICTGFCRTLDGGYTIFGRVVSGLDVVEAISRVPTAPDERPLRPIAIIKAELIEG